MSLLAIEHWESYSEGTNVDEDDMGLEEDDDTSKATSVIRNLQSKKEEIDYKTYKPKTVDDDFRGLSQELLHVSSFFLRPFPDVVKSSFLSSYDCKLYCFCFRPNRRLFCNAGSAEGHVSRDCSAPKSQRMLQMWPRSHRKTIPFL